MEQLFVATVGVPVVFKGRGTRDGGSWLPSRVSPHLFSLGAALCASGLTVLFGDCVSWL